MKKLINIIKTEAVNLIKINDVATNNNTVMGDIGTPNYVATLNSSSLSEIQGGETDGANQKMQDIHGIIQDYTRLHKKK